MRRWTRNPRTARKADMPQAGATAVWKIERSAPAVGRVQPGCASAQTSCPFRLTVSAMDLGANLFSQAACPKWAVDRSGKNFMRLK